MDLNNNAVLVGTAVGLGVCVYAASSAGSGAVGGYAVVKGSAAMPDVQSFVRSLESTFLGAAAAEGTVYVGRSPGRLDVMGGIADYSGSLVLQMPIAEATFVALQKNTTGSYSLKSDSTDVPTFELPVVAVSAITSYEEAQKLFQGKPGGDWAAYILGCFVVLSRECGHTFTEGCNIQVHSDASTQAIPPPLCFVWHASDILRAVSGPDLHGRLLLRGGRGLLNAGHRRGV